MAILLKNSLLLIEILLWTWIGIHIIYFFTEKKKFGNFVEEDPDLLESLGKSSKRRKSTHKNLAPIDEDDDDFSPTVKERDRKRAEKRREAAKRVRNLRL